MTDRLPDGLGRTSDHSRVGKGGSKGNGNSNGSGSGSGRLVIAMLVSGLVLVLVMAAIVVFGSRLLTSESNRPAFTSTGSWPATGQGAYRVVGEEIAVS